MKFLKYFAVPAMAACTALAVVSASHAQSDEANTHPAIQQYLDADLSMIGWVDVKQLDIANTRRLLETITPTPLPSREVEFAESIQKLLRDANVDKIYFVAGMSAILGDRSSICAVLPCTKPADVAKKLRGNQALADLAFHETPNAVLVAANKQGIDSLLKTNDKPSAAMSTAIAKAEGIHGIAMAPPASFIQTILQMNAKGEASGLAVSLLEAVSDLQWMTLTEKSASQPLNVDSSFKSADGAAKFAKLANGALQSAASMAEPVELFVAKQEHVTVQDKALTELLPKVLAKAKGNASEQLSMNNMKQLGLAFHNFASANSAFLPQSLTDKKGNRLLSWRVLVLPYIDQNELYNKFHLDEPWDSPHNMTLIDKMPQAYASPVTGEVKQLDKGHTRYVSPITKNSVLGTPGDGMYFQHVTDGTSNTIWLVEATPEHSVIWTKPEDLVIDSDDPLVKIVSSGHSEFNAGFLDGSVRKLSSKIAKEIANSLFSVNGGEVIDSDALNPKP